jgi:hypothetical protein
MRVLYSHKQAYLLKLCRCYIIYVYMFKNFRVELLPKGTGNGYRNMQIVIFEKECPVVVCLQSTRSPVTIC